LEEGHEAGGLAAARERLVLAAQRGEVGPGARTVLEDAGLARPEVHDPAVVDQIVGHGLDEAVVHHHAMGEGLPTLSLNVVNGLHPDCLDPDDLLLAEGRQELAGEALRASRVELVPLVLGDESDYIAEAAPRLRVADREVVGRAAIAPRLHAALNPTVDAE